MSAASHLLFAGLIVMVVSVTAFAGAKRKDVAWNYYHFNGSSFVAGQPKEGLFVAVREGAIPVVLAKPVKIEAVALPSGKGAVAGICYIQSRGGKLGGGGNGYVPASGLQVDIFSGSNVVTTVETDENGYFTAVLNAGNYRIGNPPLAIEFSIARGTTTLASLRTGKRMVD